MHTFPKVGIIVLNHNGQRCLLPCLESLQALRYQEKDIIVIDNNSGDGSFDAAKKRFPHFTFLCNAQNDGFAKGMNSGIRLALSRGAEWCWLFNYDALAAKESLQTLMRAADDNPHAGLLSPAISDVASGRLWFGKGRIDFFRMRTLHTVPTREERLSKTYPSEFLTGCALLIKKDLIERIGFLDERYFLYYEDADYSLRAWRAGFACLVVPGANVAHSEASRMNPKKTYFLVYSGLVFFQQWTPFFLRPYVAAYVTIRRVKNVLDRLMHRGSASQEVHRAYRDYFYER